MNISRLFIQRPIATFLLMMAVVLAGAVGYGALPVSALPEVDYPTIQVVTTYPGASAQIMASTVTAPLEKQLGQMQGLTQMLSYSSNGAAVITLQFALSLNIDIAEQEVQAAINASSNLLPTDLPQPPTYNKVNPADAPIITMAISSKTMPLYKVQGLLDARFIPKLAQVEGVGQVSIGGSQKPAFRIKVNQKALSALGLGMEELRQALVQANVNMAKGSFDGPYKAGTIEANDQLSSVEDIGAVALIAKGGGLTRIRDVAQVSEAAENSQTRAWVDGTEALVVSIQKQPGSNVIKTAQSLSSALPGLIELLPADVSVRITSDRTQSIKSAIRDVSMELCFAIFLVIAVMYAFLRSPSATLIPAIVIPVALIGTFGVIWFLRFSINNLTLMALTVATGFVVDDAIVMVENIARWLEEGETALSAALKGAKQIGFTIISLTVSLIAVLIPLLFMEDVIGRLFREFAVTLAIAIIISALVSLTLTPMLCSKLLKARGESDGWISRLIAMYGSLLRVTIRNQKTTLMVFVLTAVASIGLYVAVPKGFLPTQDTGLLAVTIEDKQDSSFEKISGSVLMAQRELIKDSAVESVTGYVGVDGNNLTLSSGRLQVSLKEKGRRDELQVILKRLRALLPQGQIAAIQDLTLDSRASKSSYLLTLEHPSQDLAQKWGRALSAQMQLEDELSEVSNDIMDKGRNLVITVNRDAAAAAGVSVSAISSALYDSFGQRMISTIFTQSNQVKVILESDINDLGGVNISSSTRVGSQIPLSEISSQSEQAGLIQINRQGQMPVVGISFDVLDKSLEDGVIAVDRAKSKIGLPDGIQLRYQGSAKAFKDALSKEPILLLAAIITMYIVLGILYESLIHPITILSTLPSAGIGATLALLAAGAPLDVLGIIGIILLIGIVKKNAIMMVDFAIQQKQAGETNPEEAIYQAALLRFRPILMTTLAALLGALPLMLGGGSGSELRYPLGLTMVGGLIFSQMLTLFTVPAVYLYFEKRGHR